MEEIKKDSLNEIADEVIAKIPATSKDPFRRVTVVCHNTKVAQWFKAYYLKHNDGVLMNVEFMTLSQLIGDIVNPERKYTILDRVALRRYIIKVLSDPKACGIDVHGGDFPTAYVCHDDDSVKGIGLFELSGKLATLFLRYELENEDFAGWEETLYRKVMEAAEADGWYTVKRLFETKKEELRYPDGEIYVINNSYISELYLEILKAAPEGAAAENIHLYSIEEATEGRKKAELCGKIVSAPSKLREIEALHTAICKAVQADKTTGSGQLRFNDFLVYAPNIGDYATAIHRVFEQNDPGYPSIPFRIAGETKDREDMADSLSLLYDIACKRFFTRNDFYRFVKNPILKRGKDISDREIDLWMKAITDTNTHRNGKDEDDWDYLINRMMISDFVSATSDYENKTELGGVSYLPYASMELDRREISRMCDMIMLLKDWTGRFTDELKDLIFKKSDQENVLKVLDDMYSHISCDGDELNYLYRGVKEELEELIRLNITLPADALLLLLSDVPTRYSVSAADLFAGGVTFVSMNCDDVVSAKYIYGIGLSSENFPRVERKSELDKGDNRHKSEDLDKMSVENILLNADHVTFSYVNCDLQKDAEFYPSSLITKYYPYTEIEEILEKIPLDESRPYEDLFTKKEFKGKKHFEEIGKTPEAEDDPGKEEEVCTEGESRGAASEDPAGNAEEDPAAASGASAGAQTDEEVLRVSDLKSYLENTFVYKYKKLLGDSEDDGDILDEYEPIDVNGLVKYSDIKEMILTGFEAGLSGGTAVQQQEQEKLTMEKRLPEKKIGDAYFELYHEKSVQPLLDKLTGFAVSKPEPLEMTTGTGIHWQLKNNKDMFAREDGADLYYIEPQDYYLKAPKNKTYFNMYAFSLMDLAQRKAAEPEREYTVHLGPDGTEKQYSMTPSKAYERLNEFYAQMTDYENIRYMDIDYVEKIQNDRRDPAKPAVDIPATIDRLKGDLSGEYGHNSWTYFSDRQMADPKKDFGYKTEDISADFLQMCDGVGRLIAFDLK